MSDTVSIKVWMHPSMASNVPFTFDKLFSVSKNLKIVDLMDLCETDFEKASAVTGSRLELQINVLWNIKNQCKTLNPQETVGQHFETSDSFGVYGEVQPATQCEPQKPESEKIPVTILTGFLGSGKTTLLNYILKEQSEKKIAVIENEFGEVSIDDDLLNMQKSHKAEKVITMDNGCMCCTVRGDLSEGLLELRNDIMKGSGIEQIIIETTGMADPVPIVRTFMSNAAVTADLRLDAVVALCDAKNLRGRLDDDVEEGKVNEAYQQVAFADKLILNKLDLVTTDEAIAVKTRIREINSFAKILPAVKSRVKLSEITDVRAHDMANFVNTDLEKEAAEVDVGHGHTEGGHGHGHDENCIEDHGHGGGHGDHGGHGGHGGGHGGGYAASTTTRHDARVNSFGIVKEGLIIPKNLSMWMQTIGQLPKEHGTIYRIKAIFAIKDHPYKHVFHAVMDATDEDDAAPWEEGEKKISKIIFIGKGLDQAFLRKGFEDIFE